mgnify:CR=1 FL=1
MRTYSCPGVSSGARVCGVARGSRFGLATRQPRRPQHPARREQQGRSARQLSDRARQEPARARLGRDQRAAAQPDARAAALQARLRGRLAQVPQALLEDLPEQLQRLRRPGASVDGEGLQGARRQLLGAQKWQVSAARPRLHALDRRPAPVGAPPRTGRPTSPSSRSGRTGSTTAASTTCSGATRTSASRSTVSGRPISGRRPTATGWLLYLDTHNSAYGLRLEARELLRRRTTRRASFATASSSTTLVPAVTRILPGFTGHAPQGHGDMYRMTAAGPGRDARRDVERQRPARLQREQLRRRRVRGGDELAARLHPQRRQAL